MVVRGACPICGRELILPRHRYGKKWTSLEMHWANKLLAAGLSRKAVARYFDVGVLQLQVEIGAVSNRVIIDGCEEVARLNAGLRAWAAWPDMDGDEAGKNPAVGFGPDNTVVGLLVGAFLLEIEDGEQSDGDRGNSQQGSDHPVI